MHLARAAVPVAVLLEALLGAARCDTLNFTAQLAAEADAQTTAANPKGVVALSLDSATRTVHWRIEYSGLPQPPRGVGCGELTAPTGPAIWQSDRLRSPISGEKTLTPQEAASLAAGRWVCVVDSEEADIGGTVKPAR